MLDLGPDTPEVIAAKMTILEFYGSEWGEGDDGLTDLEKKKLERQAEEDKKNPAHPLTKAMSDLNYACWDLSRKSGDDRVKQVCAAIKATVSGDDASKVFEATKNLKEPRNLQLVKAWMYVLKNKAESIAKKYRKYMPDELAKSIEAVYAAV